MKILLVNTRHYFGGGDSTYNFNLSELLLNNHHEVAFFAMQDERNIKDRNSDLFVKYINYKKINYHKNIKKCITVLTRSIYSREARQKICRLIYRFQPNIIHLQNIHAHITPSIIFEARKCGIPIVWTLHDYKLVCPNSHFLIDKTCEICESCLSGRYYKAINKRCKKGSILASAMAALEAYVHHKMKIAEKVDYFISPSAFLRSKLIEGGYPAEKVIHLPLFLPNRMYNNDIKIDEEYILYMAKIDQIKGIFPFLEACRKIPRVRVKIVGGIEDALAKELLPKLPSNVEYLGIQYGEKLRDILYKSRAVILPSIWYENQPFTIIEAFAAGKPVIASDLGGMKELVKHGDTGILVYPGEVNALAEAMLWMSEHPIKALEMGKLAKNYAIMEHSSEKHYARLMLVYSKAYESTQILKIKTI